MEGTIQMVDKNSSSNNVLKIFNYVGGSLVFFGIACFINMNWHSLNNFIKIFSTLGSAIAAYAVGTLLHIDRRHEAASSAFFLISALVFPVGILVTLDVYSQAYDFLKASVITSAICFIIFLLSQLISTRTLFLLFTLLFGSSLYLNLINLIMRDSTVIFMNWYAYILISLGISYIFLGSYLKFGPRNALTGPLYFFGAFAILAATYCSGGFFLTYSKISMWKLVTAILILLFFYLSVPFKSKAFLYLATIFLIIYILDMSSKFADVFGAFGWPLILVLGGLALIAVGYLVFNLRKKIKSDRT
jgi:hypothetical protein